MAEGGLTVVDGTQLRSVDLSLPESIDSTITGAFVIELAYSVASSALFGITLPENLKLSALKRLDFDFDADSFRSTELDRELASSKVKDFVTAIADQLKDDPLVVAILDGNILQLFLEDEDDFAMIAENLFTDLDTKDKGKISKNEIRGALVHMGVEMGVPPFSEFPLLNDILKKHGAEGEEELGQAQFAEVLHPILKELSAALAEKPVAIIQKINVANGSKLKQILANEKHLNDVAEKILKENKDGQDRTEIMREFLVKNCKEMGLPPFKKDDEVVVLLYDEVFADTMKGSSSSSSETSEKDELLVVLKEILEKFAEQLEASPVFYDLVN
ncbi:hypothetical protein LguiA_018966 [Lonicera macranthoides]